MPQLILPKDEAFWKSLRVPDITSTDSPALFGLSPYKTAFELGVEKKAAEVIEITQTERMGWGNRLQRPIALGIGEDYGVKVRALNAYARHDSVAGFGSSFDFEIVGAADNAAAGKNQILQEMYLKHGPGLLEIKNVDWLVYRDQWADEPPAHISIQSQHQLEVINRKWIAIGVLVGGNKIEIIVQERDQEIGQMLRERITEFWKNLAKGKLPDPDFRADAAALAKFYGHAEPGKVHDARGDDNIAAIVARYKQAGDAEKAAKEDKDAAKAELLTLIGDAEKVVGDSFTISAGAVGPAHVEYDREGYRQFKITHRKPKQERGK